MNSSSRTIGSDTSQSRRLRTTTRSISAYDSKKRERNTTTDWIIAGRPKQAPEALSQQYRAKKVLYAARPRRFSVEATGNGSVGKSAKDRSVPFGPPSRLGRR
jgi:hypothetical protein